MDAIGFAIVLGFGALGFVGLVLATGAFRRVFEAPEPVVPPSQVVQGGHSPIEPPRPKPRLAVSSGRFALGLLLLLIGGAVVVFFLAVGSLASVANH
jgi:hypothetical protein